MWIEAELECRPMHDTAREDTVERRPGGERALQRRSVSGRLLRRDERLRSPRRAQHGCVDARRWREAGPRHPPDEAQLVPRSPRAAEQGRRPDGGPLRREPPLDDRIELGQRNLWIAEQTAENRSARGEGQVGDDRERFSRERQQPGVSGDHLDTRIGTEAQLESSQRLRIELDRTDAGPRVDESARKRAAAGAEVERKSAGPDPRVPHELVGEGATTKCVPAAWPRLR